MSKRPPNELLSDGLEEAPLMKACLAASNLLNDPDEQQEFGGFHMNVFLMCVAKRFQEREKATGAAHAARLELQKHNRRIRAKQKSLRLGRGRQDFGVASHVPAQDASQSHSSSEETTQVKSNNWRALAWRFLLILTVVPFVSQETESTTSTEGGGVESSEASSSESAASSTSSDPDTERHSRRSSKQLEAGTSLTKYVASIKRNIPRLEKSLRRKKDDLQRNKAQLSHKGRKSNSRDSRDSAQRSNARLWRLDSPSASSPVVSIAEVSKILGKQLLIEVVDELMYQEAEDIQALHEASKEFAVKLLKKAINPFKK
ncbi:hypothetical protein BSKO_12920 [Bryopsis sp. KO-2023]|nr:hypothetical protein BSKO_12920 [Bryopsis sp. KO-2023]